MLLKVLSVLSLIYLSGVFVSFVIYMLMQIESEDTTVASIVLLIACLYSWIWVGFVLYMYLKEAYEMIKIFLKRIGNKWRTLEESKPKSGLAIIIRLHYDIDWYAICAYIKDSNTIVDWHDFEEIIYSQEDVREMSNLEWKYVN